MQLKLDELIMAVKGILFRSPYCWKVDGRMPNGRYRRVCCVVKVMRL